MATDDYKLQVSIRTSASQHADMINIRANTPDELSVLLEGIGDYSNQIAAVAKLVQAAYTVLPLATSPSTQGTTPSISSAPAPEPTATSTVAPTCQHGPRKHKSGVSSKTGRPYSMWVCPLPQGPEQCKPVN